MKAKDVNIYKLYSDTFKGRKMFGFIGFGELQLMQKVSKPIIQVEKNQKGKEHETIQDVTDTCK
jgi:hypothetical protein|tara:strand:+ start:241 stop:432 length:192 start_codon:yes stop_codon:yes gene_type:complete